VRLFTVIRPHLWKRAKPGISRWILSLCAGFVLGGFTSLPLAHAQEPSAYRLGIFPYLPPTRLEKAYAPVAAAFARALDRPVRLGTASGFDKFRARLKKGEFDIALIQPMDVVPVVDEGGYIPLARRPSHPASIVVLEDSSLQQLVDLRGKTTGLPPADAPVSIVLRNMLDEQGPGGARETGFRNFTNVLACLHQLLVKAVDACGSGGGAALRVFQEKMGVRLRVLAETPPFPHMLFVAHPRLPPASVEMLTRIILNWEKTGEGRELLRMIGPGARFIPYRSVDYDVIRRSRRRWEQELQDAP